MRVVHVFKAIAAVSALSIMAAAAYYLSSVPVLNSRHHSLYNENLLRAATGIESLSAEMLRVETGQSLHYDFVEAELQEVKRRLGAVGVIPDFVQLERDRASIRDGVGELQEQVAVLDENVQYFKRYFSLLRNSRTHLPLIVQEKRAEGGVEEGLLVAVSNVIHRVAEATMMEAEMATREAILRDLEALASAPRHRTAFAEHFQMLRTHVEIALLYDNKVKVHSRVINSDTIPAIGAALDAIHETYLHSYLQVQEEVQATNAIVYSLLVALLLIVAVFVAFQLAAKRQLERALLDFSQVIRAQAGGDFSQVSTGRYKGKLLLLRDNINSLSQQLSRVLGDVSALTGSINATANYFADFSAQYKTEIHSISESIESSREFIAAIHGSSSDFALKADEAKLTAQQSSTKAGNGAQAMDSTVAAMQEILDKAQEMEAITDNIDSIAFQTNLLALNAAVEAARAGENGAGFAVVAQEVRNLSQRSTKASNEIRELIGDSIGKIASGNQLMQRTHDEISGVIGDIEGLSTSMESISQSTFEQSRHVGQANESIAEVSARLHSGLGSIQTAAELAGESLAQSQKLNEIVGGFKLGQG